jgi:hypothetical protein
VEAARALMELVDATGTAAGKYDVTIKDRSTETTLPA